MKPIEVKVTKSQIMVRCYGLRARDFSWATPKDGMFWGAQAETEIKGLWTLAVNKASGKKDRPPKP